MFPNYAMKEECFKSWTEDLFGHKLMGGKLCFEEQIDKD